MKWQLQWEKLLMEQLKKYKIDYEKTSFQIAPDLKKYRDHDWDKIISSGQILEVVESKLASGKLEIISITKGGLPVEVGAVSFYNKGVDYNKAIVCQLVERTLYYEGREDEQCLEFVQPIILVAAEEIPSGVLEYKTLGLKNRAGGGCLVLVVLLITFFFGGPGNVTQLMIIIPEGMVQNILASETVPFESNFPLIQIEQSTFQLSQLIGVLFEFSYQTMPHVFSTFLYPRLFLIVRGIFLDLSASCGHRYYCAHARQ